MYVEELIGNCRNYRVVLNVQLRACEGPDKTRYYEKFSNLAHRYLLKSFTRALHVADDVTE